MFKEIISRFKNGYQTNKFPAEIPTLPNKFAGLPKILRENCREGCDVCKVNCPVSCISGKKQNLSIDMGMCIFCRQCEKLCPSKAIVFSDDYKLAADTRESLLLNKDYYEAAEGLKNEMLKIFGRSLQLRQVSAGGCGACEADINVLNTLAWDLGRFGIQIVASPRHADGILVTGPITNNLKLALEKTYAAIAEPKIIIAVGACAISGGIFKGMETCNGVDSIIKVDLYIPGCPPHPLTILDGLLRLTGKIKN